MKDAVDGRINLDRSPQVDESQDASPNKQSEGAFEENRSSRRRSYPQMLCLKVRDQRYGWGVTRGRCHIQAARNAGAAVVDRVDPKCFAG
jgi:hypothetical protein